MRCTSHPQVVNCVWVGTRSFGKKQKQYYLYVNKDWKLPTPPRVDLMLVIYMYMYIDLQPTVKQKTRN